MAMATMLAAPAMAATDNFEGVRVGAIVGAVAADGDSIVNDSEVVYGVSLGYDVPVSDNLLVGVEADIAAVDNSAIDRQFSIAGRVTYPVTSNVAVYASGGYANVGRDNVNVNFDGYRVGGGAEFAVTDNVYASTEYRYSDFDVLGDTHAVLVGVGVRF